MIQIIGWLGCLYLVVKALEIFAGSSFRGTDGTLKGAAMAAVILAWLGALLFAALLYEQGNIGSPSATERAELSSSQIDCISKAEGDDAKVLACASAAP